MSRITSCCSFVYIVLVLMNMNRMYVRVLFLCTDVLQKCITALTSETRARAQQLSKCTRLLSTSRNNLHPASVPSIQPWSQTARGSCSVFFFMKQMRNTINSDYGMHCVLNNILNYTANCNVFKETFTRMYGTEQKVNSPMSHYLMSDWINLSRAVWHSDNNHFIFTVLVISADY